MAPNSTNETYKFVYDTFEDTRIEFEHKLSANLDPFVSLTKLSSKVDVILSASSRDHPTNSILVCTNENGGYAAQGYFRFKTSSGMTLWRINPFDFFEKAFATVDLPKADTTTLLGNRIFYAHIDGDGWRSVSQVPGYQEKSCNCTKVIEEEIIKKYPHLPLTIAPIVGDLDPKYFGTNEAINQAKEIFAYPQITLGSHSYTHPLDWKFYDDDNANDKEKKIFGDSQNKVEYQNNRHDVEKKVGNGYSLPRSYLYGDFNIEKELLGSIKFISSLAPKNKKVSLFQWSGDCVPFEKALSLLRQKGILNINGGYTRFDPEYPSYAFVGPVGRDEGNEWQIYSSMNNENTYTNNWTGRFYGFRFLVNTFEKTESPIRVKPLNIYYHMYSAEKEAALNLKDNYTYVDQLDKISISTKQFATIANGFFSAEFQKIDENSWLVLNRGKLNEIRFDHATFKEVDWEKSKGVIGQDYYQGSLYMTLDKSDTKPIIALKEAGTIAIEPRKAPKIYVIKSSWRLSNFNSRNAEIRFAAQGYGIGHFTFFCPEPGTYILSSSDKSSLGKNQNVQIKAQTNTQQILKVSIPLNALKPIQLKLSLENQ
jgi:hypothetical protein